MERHEVCEVVTLSCRRTQRHLSLRFLFCKTFMETEETRSDINFNNIIFMAFGRRHYSGGISRGINYANEDPGYISIWPMM